MKSDAVRNFVRVHQRGLRWTAVAVALFMAVILGTYLWAVRQREDVWQDLARQLAMRQEAQTWLTATKFGDQLVEAVIQIESSGRPYMVGAAGERGLMQIMPGTWADMTRDLFGRPLPFEMAFDRELNRAIGRHYLAHLQKALYAHRHSWQADERSLLLAAYNGGLGRLQGADFDLHALPQSVQTYVARVAEVHDELLGDDADRFQEVLAAHLPPAQ